VSGGPTPDTGGAVAVLLIRHVPVPAAEVSARLSEAPGVLLGHAATSAGRTAPDERHLLPLTVRLAGVRFDRTAAVGFGPLVEEDDGSRLLPLWWEAADHPGLFPTFAGGLEIRPDGGGAELRLEGQYRPPFGGAGRLVDRTVLNRAATASLETLLDDLASKLAPADPATGPGAGPGGG